MASPDPSLDDLRREIDAVDDAMHDLVMRRAGLAARLGELAGGPSAVALSPAREALILRRLLRRHTGPFPAHALVRIWREMIGGSLRRPFAVAIHAPEKSVGYWDIARDHFGSGTLMSLHRSARRVVREVAEGRAAVGVLAKPSDGEADPWWPLLLGAEPETPRVVARLPFVDNEAGRFEDLGAFAIARAVHEPTGEDRTLIALEIDAELSRARLRELLAKAGFEAEDVAVWAAPEAESTRLCLIEAAGHVAAGDGRFAELEAQVGKALQRIVGLGAYAVPVGAFAPARR